MWSRDEVLATCRATWERLGVPRGELEEMVAELHADLHEAGQDGVDPVDYVAGDPQGFAKAWAEQRGLIRARLYLGAAALLAVLGAVPGAGLGLFFAYGLSSDAFTETFGGWAVQPDGAMAFEKFYPAPALILGLYGLAGLLAAGGALLAVRSYLEWREDIALRATTLHLLIGLVPAVALAAAGGILFAWYRDFQAEQFTMLGVGLVAAATFGAAVAALRAISVHHASAPDQPRTT